MQGVTLCLTIGRRPELLRQTLDSLFAQDVRFDHIIAVNDFGDVPTSEVFKALCPDGELVDLGRQVGHHAAVDAMYRRIQTPYVFHCEDDWLFDGDLMLDNAASLLTHPQINSVCLRRLPDFPFYEAEAEKIDVLQYQGVDYCRLDHLHEQWHRYTFNPHLAKLDLWQSSGGFSRFKKERHISRWQGEQNRFVAFMQPGACVHIGENLSVSNPKPSWFKQMKQWLRKR
ncbi:glycosyltransferase involved in cell wall biosynthesis [Neisseria sp. HSC-16F19]|nr:glycosyltransferase [Neisseria sp. HSC-16F19]MCP2039945.1 glycosyltransferase involved in cell wall biosynthesis [Neisseria sp. HSC-16F19]